MNNLQRWFLVASLFLLAAGLPLYCLDYRVVSADSLEQRIQVLLSNAPQSQREFLKAQFENNPETRVAIPLISFGESQPKDISGRKLTAEEEFLEPTALPTFSGIYARAGLDALEAVIGGILAPVLLLIAAGYVTLGTRTNAPGKESAAPTESPQEHSATQIDQEREAEVSAQRGSGAAAFLMAFAPMLVANDLPLMMLCTRYRYPRWVFVVHCFLTVQAHGMFSPNGMRFPPNSDRPAPTEVTPSLAPLEVTPTASLDKPLEETPPTTQADTNPESNKKFLADNAKRPGVKVTADGLQYRIIKAGTGKTVTAPTDNVTVTYKGALITGQVFDQTMDGMPATFPVGPLIPGWVEALQMMKEGDEWEIVIPSNLGYGEAGAGGVIPPNQTLIFTMALLKVEPQDAQ